MFISRCSTTSCKKWIARNGDLPIGGPLLQEKTKCFANTLNVTNIKANDSCLKKFCLRHEIVFYTIFGEVWRKFCLWLGTIKFLKTVKLAIFTILMKQDYFSEQFLTKDYCLKKVNVLEIKRRKKGLQSCFVIIKYFAHVLLKKIIYQNLEATDFKQKCVADIDHFLKYFEI